MNDFFEADYEVNFNFGLIIYYDTLLGDYKKLFEEIDDDVEKMLDMGSAFLYTRHIR